MLVFIDESGDAGFKLARGSTPIFAAAMIVFANHDEAARTQRLIKTALATFHRRPEFKFNKTSFAVRDKFFDAVAGCDFAVRAIVVRKDRIWSARLRSDDASFYRFFVKSLVRFDNRVLQRAMVIIDGSGDRDFRTSLQRYLKAHADHDAIAGVKLRNSRTEPLLQLADMCVGAIARAFRSDRAGHDRWYRRIRDKIDDVWEFK